MNGLTGLFSSAGAMGLGKRADTDLTTGFFWADLGRAGAERFLAVLLAAFFGGLFEAFLASFFPAFLATAFLATFFTMGLLLGLALVLTLAFTLAFAFPVIFFADCFLFFAIKFLLPHPSDV